VDTIAESGDILGDNEDEEDANDEPLRRPSVFSSVRRTPSITSPYSSSSASTAASSKSTVVVGSEGAGGGGGDGSSNNLSSVSDSSISELALLLFCITRGGLKLRSRPNTRITPFRALADNEDVLEEESKRRARNAAPWIWDWLEEDAR